MLRLLGGGTGLDHERGVRRSRCVKGELPFTGQLLDSSSDKNLVELPCGMASSIDDDEAREFLSGIQTGGKTRKLKDNLLRR